MSGAEILGTSGIFIPCRIIPWTDFTLDKLKSVYGDVSSQPIAYEPRLDLKRRPIGSKAEFESLVYSHLRGIQDIIGFTLETLKTPFDGDIGKIVFTQERKQPRPPPQKGFFEPDLTVLQIHAADPSSEEKVLLHGEIVSSTVLSSEWFSSDSIQKSRQSIRTLERLVKYLLASDTSYGFIGTKFELIPIKISYVSKDPPSDSDQAERQGSTDKNAKIRPFDIQVEWASVPWDAQGPEQLNTNLALWWLVRTALDSSSINDSPTEWRSRTPPDTLESSKSSDLIYKLVPDTSASHDRSGIFSSPQAHTITTSDFLTTDNRDTPINANTTSMYTDDITIARDGESRDDTRISHQPVSLDGGKQLIFRRDSLEPTKNLADGYTNQDTNREYAMSVLAAETNTTRTSATFWSHSSGMNKTDTVPTEPEYAKKSVYFADHPRTPPLLEGDRFDRKATRALTVYSGTGLENDTQTEFLIDCFADFICVQMSKSDAELTWSDIGAITMQQLLGSYAMRLGITADHRFGLQAMKFIYRYRAKIASRLETKLRSLCDDEQDIGSENDSKQDQDWRSSIADPTPEEKFNNWSTDTTDQLDPFDKPHQDHDAIDVESVNDSDTSEGPNQAWLTELRMSPNLSTWLASRLRRELTMYHPSPLATLTIYDIVTSYRVFPLEVRSASPPRMYSRDLSMDWRLMSFINDQARILQQRGWTMKNVIELDTLGNAITITGSTCDAQAMRCGDYLDQVWPETGREVLNFVVAIFKDASKEFKGTFTDGTKIAASQSQQGLQFTLSGTICAIAEIFDILGWLSSAFQPTAEGATYCCSPRLEAEDVAGSLGPTEGCSFKMHWETKPVYPEKDEATCWYKMFNSPLIVFGYPITRRRHYSAGLECSLPIVNTLMQNPHISVLDQRYLYIKNVSTMLIPTGLNDDSILWHYVYHPDGKYLDFLESEIVHEGLVGYNDFTKRHIIGWCPKIINRAGAPWPEGQEIGSSGLARPPSTIEIKSVNINLSHMGIGINIPVSVCVRDVPLQLPADHGGTENMLDDLENTYVILWDTSYATSSTDDRPTPKSTPSTRALQNQRGWLLDGASALLHLLRANLEAYRLKWPETFMLQKEDLLEPHLKDPTGKYNRYDYPDAVSHFFMRNSYHNLNLEIFRGEPTLTIEVTTKLPSTGGITDPQPEATPTEPVKKLVYQPKTVRHEFLRLWEILSHLRYFSEMRRSENKEGFEFALQDLNFNQHLFGWDFRDVVRLRGSRGLESRMAVLPAEAKPWVELTRSVSTINLFGTGFGELMEADSADIRCPHWTQVPTRMNYLAANRSTIESIFDKNEHVRERFRLSRIPPSGKRPCDCREVHLHTITQKKNVLQKKPPQMEPPLQHLVQKEHPAAYIFGTTEPKHISKSDKDATESAAVADDAASTIGVMSQDTSDSNISSSTLPTTLDSRQNGTISFAKGKLRKR